MMLQGSTAIITGAAAGIGRGFAEVFAAEGADIALCDVQADKLAETADAIRVASDRRVFTWVCDVRDAADVHRFVDEAVKSLGGLDILVINAGVWRPTNPLTDPWEQAVADWSFIVDTNLRGVFLTGRAAIPHLVARGGGNIVNIATDHICPPAGYATGGGTRMDIYDASKWGVNGLTQGWAKFLRPHGVRVNALCMDATDSEMLRAAAGESATPEQIATWMRPEQMARLALDLIAEGPDGRTGENIGAWLGHPVELPPRRDVLPSRHA